MKKVLRGVVIVALIVVMLLALTACNKYKWGPVGSTEYSQEEAVGNGTLAVKQGKYLYFVNNVADDASLTKDQNEWGANGTNGAIMKSKINDDGTLECLGIVVPKMYYTDTTNAGIYVYGEWIYYVARSQQTDNKGNLINSLEFLRTTTDGTKTQSIAIVADLTTNYIFSKTGLLYTIDSNIHYVDLTGKKFKDTVVVEKYTDLFVSEDALSMFYTKASDNEYVLGNNLGVVEANGANKIIIAESAYYKGEGDYKTNPSTLFTLDIINYKDGVIYYTKTCKDADAKVSTVGYALTEEAFNDEKEVKFANKALSTIYPLGLEKGVVDVSSTTVVAYKPIAKDAIEEAKSDELTMTANITILFNDEAGHTYYLMNSNLYRANIFVDTLIINKNAYEEKVSKVSIGTKYGAPSELDGYLYYESSDDATYLSRIKLAYDEAAQEYLKGYIVSGYTAYTYPEDADYVINEDDDLIKDKVPAYMTEADMTKYVSNHKTTNEA